MKIRIKTFATAVMTLFVGLLWAQNLIQNPDFDRPFKPECRFDMTRNAVTASIFTEDRTWNNCLKLEVNQYHKQKDGTEKLYAHIRIGGDKKNPGAVAKPNTIYNFSIDLKGTAPATLKATEWNGTNYWKNMKSIKIKGQTSFKDSPDEWVTLKGTFRTGSEATHIALGVMIWGESRWKNLPPVGSYVLIDNVIIEEKADLLGNLDVQQKGVKPTISQENVILAGNDSIDGLKEYKTGKKVKADTVVDLQTSDKSILLNIRCLEPLMDKLQAGVKEDGVDPWKDDSVEILFGPVVKDRKLSQFVVTAGGGRWMGHGDKSKVDGYNRWQAKVTIEENAWVADVEIPYDLLGWENRPDPGSEIRFNIARNRKPVRETSSWSFANGSFHDISRFGVLLFDSVKEWKDKRIAAMKHETTDQELLDKISNWTLSGRIVEDYNKALSLQQEIKLAKHGNISFVLTQIPPTADPTIPFLPAAIANPPSQICVRAAGNELKAVPLAITNALEQVEEYRVVVSSVTSQGAEDGYLQTSSGEKFPPGQVRLCRAIRVKDGDGEKHGHRFDPLVPMDVSCTIIVQPKESTPLWIIFDTHHVPAGKYTGVIRVIPLGQRAKLNSKSLKYTGPMQELSFELEVLPFALDRQPVRSQFLFQRVFNEACFDMLINYGSDTVLVNTWGFRVSFNKDGSVAKRNTQAPEREILRLRKWAAKYKMTDELKICVAYSAYKIFRDVHAKKQFNPNSQEWKRAWSEYVRILEDVRKKCDISNLNFIVELLDEPSENNIDELISAARIAHETVPDMNFMIVFGAPKLSLQKLEQLVPYVNYWCFWDTRFFARDKYATLMQKLRLSKKKIANYTCATSMRQNLYQYYRLHPWVGEAYKLDMSCMYQFMTHRSRFWDWKMATRGEIARMAGEHPVSTIRQECLRIGANDLKYLKKLSDIIQDSNGSRHTKLRSEAESFLKTIVTQVSIEKRYDSAQAEAARNQAIDYILELIK